MMNILPDYTDVPTTVGANRRLGDLMGPYEENWDNLLKENNYI